MLISPSLFAANPACYAQEIASIEAGGADLLHLDVMDGGFVPKISFGVDLIRGLRCVTSLPFDVHLMVHQPQRLILPLIQAGADSITVAIESTDQIEQIHSICSEHHVSFGIAISPETDPIVLDSFLHQVDLILIMSIPPGTSGHPFMMQALDKIGKLSRLKAQNRYSYHIGADGSINEQNAAWCAKAGADFLVAGNSIFSCKQRGEAIHRLRTSF